MKEYFEASLSEELRVLLNIIVAIILTGIIGLEREKGNKPAGFRTNMLVGAAACLLISLGTLVVEELFVSISDKGVPDNEALRYDPLRIIEAVVVGVSFIGGGTILKSESKEKVRYLTSAATILLSAGVGIAVGVEKYILAAGVTLIVVTINKIIAQVEKRFGNENRND